MKRFGLRFLFLLVFPAGLIAGEVLDLWSGREIVLPGTGGWTLSTGHGRVLRAGSDEARFTLPPLADGATLDATLNRGKESHKLRFHSPAPLTGVRASLIDLPPEKRTLFLQYGLPENPGGSPEIRFCGIFPPETEKIRLAFVFPERRDFPLRFEQEWEEISLRRTKNPGCLDIVSGRHDRQLDLDGTFTCAVLRRNGRTIVVFSPDFDLGKIENILLIQKLLEEERLWKKP